MQFYEQHYERYYLREYIGMWYPNILRAVLFWILIKLNLKQLKRKPFPVFRSIQDNLMELEQVAGSRLNELKLTGVGIISRHQKGDSVVSVILDFDDAQVKKRPYFIFTFLNDVTGDITSSNGRFMCYSDPGGDIAYYPKVCFEELVEIHNQRIRGLNRNCSIINDNLELIKLSDERWVKSIDKLIRRGILKISFSQ